MYRSPMAVSPAAVLIVVLRLSGALWADEGQGWEVADSLVMRLS